LAASRLPLAVRIVPSLGVLRGPLGLLLALAAIGLAAAAVVPRPRLPRPRASVLFAVAWGFLLTVGLAYVSRLRVSGDEPHYLLMAQSLWREHDLDLQDNIDRGDWREYTPGPISPHYGFPRADGRPFPAHSPGLPLLLAPVYAIGGRVLCVVLLTLAGALLGVEMWRIARPGGDDEAALLAWILVLIPPVAFYSFLVYTEVPAALALAVGMRMLRRRGPATDDYDRDYDVGRGVAGALLAAALPWLHLKMAPAAAALGLLGLVGLRGRARLAFAGTAAMMAAAFLAYYHAIFGVASPLAIYGGVPKDADGSPLRALAGLLLDRSFGLLPYAPVFLIGLAGLGVLVRARRWDALTVGAAVVGPALAWRMWWGGQCPPARFLVPASPLFALAIAERVRTSHRGVAHWRWVLAALGIATTVGMTAAPGALLLLNRGDRPTRLWAALSGERPVARYLPSLVSASADEVRVALVWAAAIALLLALDAVARRREGADRLFRGLGLPIVLALSVGVAVDAWARRGPENTTAVSPDPSPD